MNIIKPSYEIMGMFPAAEDCLQWIERIGRLCYKSEARITADSSPRFIRQILKLDKMDKLEERIRQVVRETRPIEDIMRCVRDMLSDPPHESVIEHSILTVRFVFDRGISHEIVRHRVGTAFTQESTRYCNYGKTGGVKVIEQPFWEKSEEEDSKYVIWKAAMVFAESFYLDLLAAGASPQEARAVLPTGTKTEIVVSANFREWRHIFFMRTSSKAHPQMREVMIPLLKEIQGTPNLALIFEDIEPCQS